MFTKKCIALSLLATVCSVAYAGEIADLYKKSPQQPPILKNPNPSSLGERSYGITEVGLERTRCFGTCPAYSVTIKSDGTVRYKGEAFVKKVGLRTGKVSPVQFNNLAQLLNDTDYMNLGTNYSAGVTDNPTVYSTVVKNGKRKVISNYANSGPAKLWAVEQLIDKLMLDAQWNDEKPVRPRR